MHPNIRRWLRRLLTAALCLVLLRPVGVSAASLYFTSINDNLLPLTNDTMPVWSGGTLYVPYTVFDAAYTGIDLGLYCSYSRSYETVTIFRQQLSSSKILSFDIRAGTCRDDISQTDIPARAIMRSGKPFLPVNTVCAFFGLGSSYNSIPTVPQGYLVRIKNSAVVLTDSQFLDAGSNFIDRRLREYNQSMNPTPPPPAKPSNPSSPSESVGPAVRTYLGIACSSGDEIVPLLGELEKHGGSSAVLFLPPEVLRARGSLVFRIMSSGNIVGLRAAGATWEECRKSLEEGQQLLEQLAFTRATAALLPYEFTEDAEKEGWVCWPEDISAVPDSGAGANSFAYGVMRRLQGRTRPVHLLLEESPDMTRVLPALLQQFRQKNFDILLPLETTF